MNSADVKAVQEMLSKPQQFVIIPHKNPDGDAIGATLCLYHYLRQKGHNTQVIAPNDYPEFLKWMPGNEAIINFEKNTANAKEYIKNATVICTLDFNDLSRTGQMQSLLKEVSATYIMIDHHQSPSDYADIVYSDVTISSTCEMVYNFIESLGDLALMTVDMAECLYTGIMTDTGSFKYPSTTSRTHKVIADLIEKGANNTEIHNNIYDTNSAEQLRLLGVALKNLVILEEYNTAFITLSQSELDTHNFKKGDTEGFVNYGLTLKGIKFAAIFIESKEEQIIKISLRSKGDFSVNEFARKYFNGGGHTNAAGGRSEKSMEETTNCFISLLENYKKVLTK